jgi:branched-chain amino acid transport system substrate-binding protein
MKAWLKARTKDDPVRTVLGPFSWDKVGLPIDRPFLMAQWQGGELKFIYPTDEFEGVSPLLYPKPQW